MKKYQIFISSTYRDLVNERRSVEETIIRCGDFPVGMEAFPAADEEQLDFIKTIISNSDFYILLIAGKYGSTDDSGISFTEREYDYAVSCGVPVLVFLRSGTLSEDQIEISPDRRASLARFIEKATSKRLRREWVTLDGLKLAVRESLDHAKSTKNRPGWVRGDTVASEALMSQLIRANDRIKELEESVPPAMEFEPADLQTKIFVGFGSGGGGGHLVEESTFEYIFKMLGPKLMDGRNVMYIRRDLTELFRLGGTNPIREQSVHDIRIQLEALGLIAVERANWRLTALGRQRLLELRVFRKSDETAHKS